MRKRKVIMRKRNKGGRRKSKAWDHFEASKEKEGYIKCKHCEDEFASTTSATRLKAHLGRKTGKGISICQGIGSDNKNSIDLKGNVLLSSQRQIQADAKDQKSVQVSSSSVSSRDDEESQVLQYVRQYLREDAKVYESPLSHLTQKEFATLKPEAYLDSLNAALKGSVSDFWDFVDRQKIIEHYTSGDLNSCEKMFIPVHIGETHCGHFYLYIIHLMNEEIEIWDPLPKTTVAQRDEISKKLLGAMDVLFFRKFTKFELKIANNDTLFQDNGFDCGIFVINYMQQSNNYVKRDDSIFQFDSSKEREVLALKLLKSDLNQVKQDLYEEARQHYAAQVKKQELGKLIVACFGDISAFNNIVRSLEENCVLRSFDFTLRDDDDDDILINRGDSVEKRISLEYVDLENRKVVLPGDTKKLTICRCRQGRGNRHMCSVLSYAHNNYLQNNTHQIENLQIYSSFHEAEYLCCLSGSCSFCCSCELVGYLSLFDLRKLKYLVSPSDDLPSLHQTTTLFSQLTELDIKGCHNMESVMTSQLLALLQNLHSLSVVDCMKMKEIVREHHSEMQLDTSDELMAILHNNLSHPTLTLPKLTFLYLDCMPQLHFIYRGLMLCPSLQSFSTKYCKHLNLSRIEISNGCAIQMEKTLYGYYWPIQTA